MLRTQFGNWIFAVGGNPIAARMVGVPVSRVKILLFMNTALAAWLVAMIEVSSARSADVLRGEQREFYAIIAAVIGGVLLTGGYGTVVGAVLGALIYGMVRQGVVFAGIDADWVSAVPGRDAPGRRPRQSLRPPTGAGSTLMADLATAETMNGHANGGTLDVPRGTRLLALEDASKYFGSVIALEDVSMDLKAGEVHALLGDNGAGKSTLIKILSGVYQPDEGRYLVDGKEVHFTSPRDALAMGIATVYQDLAMIPLMGISRNFFLGQEPEKGWGPFKRFDLGTANDVTREELHKMGIEIRDPEHAVGTLSGGERQSVAIARAVYFGARVLILDEPTAALGVKEAAVVLKYIAQARARELGVIFITHNVHHAYPIADRFTILNRGRSYGTFEKKDVSREQVVQMMAGGEELEKMGHELEEFARADAEADARLPQTSVAADAEMMRVGRSLEAEGRAAEHDRPAAR